MSEGCEGGALWRYIDPGWGHLPDVDLFIPHTITPGAMRWEEHNCADRGAHPVPHLTQEKGFWR